MQDEAEQVILNYLPQFVSLLVQAQTEYQAITGKRFLLVADELKDGSAYNIGRAISTINGVRRQVVVGPDDLPNIALGILPQFQTMEEDQT